MAIAVEHRMPETKPAYRAADEQTIELGRPWLCLRGHLLGYVRRDHGVHRLHLAEGHVITGLADIRCPLCGALRTWDWARDSLDRLLARAGRPAS